MGKNVDKYVENSLLLKETRNARDLVGIRVLTVSGEVLGRVKEVRLNPTSAVLEGVLLYVGRRVVSSDGKVFGNVREVRRVHQTNGIESLLVKRTFFRKATIPFSQVKKLGT